jgi:hypothetical protein
MLQETEPQQAFLIPSDSSSASESAVHLQEEVEQLDVADFMESLGGDQPSAPAVISQGTISDQQLSRAPYPVEIRASPEAEILAEATASETATVAQPDEKVTTRESRWTVGMTVGLLVFLSGAISVTVYRNLPGKKAEIAKRDASPPEGIASSSPRVERQGPVATQGPDVRELPTGSTHVTSIPPEARSPIEKSTPADAALNLKTKEQSQAKALTPSRVETPATKPMKTTATQLDTAAIKKPERIASGDLKHSEASTTAENREQPISQRFKTTPERTEKLDVSPTDLALLKPSSVPQVELRKLSITATRWDLSVKEREILTIKGKLSDGSEIYIDTGVQWRSSNPGVASVNSRGEIQALKEGATQISATYQGVASDNYTMNVRASEEIRKPDSSGEQIKDLRRRLLR